MAAGPVFISHASADDGFVKELRVFLARLGLTSWVDSRHLRGGDTLLPEIKTAIEQAGTVIGVLSPHAVNSSWVRLEIQHAEKVAKKRKGDGYAVIPILLPGIEPTALGLWFKKEPLGIKVQIGPGGLTASSQRLAEALGLQLPDDFLPPAEVIAEPLEELRLKLSDPTVELAGGRTLVKAMAVIHYDPADPTARQVESRRFPFTAPLGPIERNELRWYLEEYFRWPLGLFAERAKLIEARLPAWGRDLYNAALAPEVARGVLTLWKNSTANSQRRFSIEVDRDLPDGAAEDAKKAAREAACQLFALPWELLHDGGGYLFQGAKPVGVRRRLPQRDFQPGKPAELPIRVLLVSPRPEDKSAGYIDHRASALPLVEALLPLGDLVELTVLSPPTLPALQQSLDDSLKAGKPFHVIHFDGHGVYDREHGLGALCFEDPRDVGKLTRRGSALVQADALAGLVKDHRIPVVFLEACQTAQAERDITSSVAGKLLDEGVTSVVAMSHSVLVETARRFVGAFYKQLARGETVGQAMLAGQKALEIDKARGQVPGAGALNLDDWFVPVLYQEDHDPQLFNKIPSEAARRLMDQARRGTFGALPEPPPHHFIGRSRELLMLERLLAREGYAVVRGVGGEGKTTLAVELARWLVRSARFDRSAFVSVEHLQDLRAVVDALGQQLLPAGWSVAQFPKLEEALQHIDRALRDDATLLVFDNLESILPDHDGQPPRAALPVAELFALCQRFFQAAGKTRALFTTREALPAPFADAGCVIALGALSPGDAVELVASVMKREGLEPPATDPGGTPDEIHALVESVGRHARALTLLAREVARRGVRATTANVQGLMAALHQQHPDDRERSLFASVELSLRRLRPETREKIRALAVFQGGANLRVFGPMIDRGVEETRRVADELIAVGLGADMGYGYLQLDPALPAYLLGQMPLAEQAETRVRWAKAMRGLLGFLYQQQSQNAQMAASLTRLDLRNLLALLDWMRDNTSPEDLVGAASNVETLVANLGLPQALARVVALREAAAARLGTWSHAQFLTASATIDRLLDTGDLPSAYALAQKLLTDCTQAGESAYAEASYDLATAHFRLGRVLFEGGAAEAALEPLAAAQEQFEKLAKAGNPSAERMASTAITERGECLTRLGRLDEAAAMYEESIRRDQKRGDLRDVAVAKLNLGTVRLRQSRYADALAALREAKDVFDALGEPRHVAVAWHQIGMVHRQAGQFEEAERAYRQSLALEVQQRNRSGEAGSLGELGNLYRAMGRPDEAVSFHLQAADKYGELPDQAGEGRARGNAGNVLVQLGRHDEARRELLRAIACDEPYGHAAEPWKTWNILSNLEQATGHPEAAYDARQKAIQAFLAYRRAGGENHSVGDRLCRLVAQAIQENQLAAAEQTLAEQAARADLPAYLQALIPKLQAIVRGQRDPGLADDPALDYDDAAELLLLLEGLRSGLSTTV